MKVVAIIPARYNSTRLPGKPIIDICGHPMIWWVYQQVKKVKEFSEVYVATDDERIMKVCKSCGMNAIMTRDNHPDHISRVQEVSESIEADYYMCINGDEPLIEEKCIEKVIPKKIVEEPYFCGARRKLTNPVETVDSGNIKLVMTNNNRCIYMSRTPVPYPKGTILYDYWKYVGIECFNKKALDLFVSKEKGLAEKIEDIDHLRFIENGVNIYFKEVNSKSLSVDTKKDLEKVRKMIEKKNNHD